MKWVLLVLMTWAGEEPSTTVSAFPFAFAEHEGCTQAEQDMAETKQKLKERKTEMPTSVSYRCVAISDEN